MTQEQINKQVEAIKRATAEACKSKKAARKFLIKAGIVKNEKNIRYALGNKT